MSRVQEISDQFSSERERVQEARERWSKNLVMLNQMSERLEGPYDESYPGVIGRIKFQLKELEESLWWVKKSADKAQSNEPFGAYYLKIMGQIKEVLEQLRIAADALHEAKIKAKNAGEVGV